MADFSLKAVFGMDATGIKTELKQLRREIGSFVESYAKIGAGVAVGAFVALSKGAIDLAGNLADASANLGINVISLQALEAQHKRNGVSSEQLITSLQKTKAAVLDASAGNEKAAEALRALGLSVERIIKLPLDKQYEAIARAATKSKNESAAYAAVCDLLGEKIGPKLMGSLRELGEEGLPAVVQSAREAGQVMEKETIVALDRAGDAIDDFKKRATIAVGNILVNFRSEEGLKLLGMQLLRILGTFGAGIVDAIVEGGQMIGAVFKGAFRGALNYLQDGIAESAKVIAGVFNRILPERFKINVEDLEKLKSTGKGIADEITEAIARTEPLNFKKTVGDKWDEIIARQQMVVDALNKKDFAAEARRLEDAGAKIGQSVKEGAKKVEDAGIKAGVAIERSASVIRSVMDGVFVALGRTGASYDQQSTPALEGVASRLRSQIQKVEREDFGVPGGVGGKGTPPELYILRSELFAVEKELKLRREASAYARRYGEDATRGQFGDSVTNRSIQDLTEKGTRTALAVERIDKRLGQLLGQPI